MISIRLLHRFIALANTGLYRAWPWGRVSETEFRRSPAPLAVTGGDVMFILGLLVLAASVVAAVELVLANHAPIDFHMWGWTWHFDAFWLAVIGAIIVTAAWI